MTANYTNHIAFALSKEQFEVWCSMWMIDSAPIIYTIVGQSKQNFHNRVKALNGYNLIILPNWNRKEYMDMEICNQIIEQAIDVCPTVKKLPNVEDGKILDWGRRKADRSLYTLPFVPIHQAARKFWTEEKDDFLTRNYTNLSIEELIKKLDGTKSMITTRADQLHLKERFSITYKPYRKKLPLLR